ncbi:alkaline phosphatase D family protein [Micromonospora sp. LOL_014]|uniref:alkaline phosphatase D family protein n=1 Tax=Micromonospora sp. LOL_014 TaxID=3345415 RepID=UPI003A8573C5
MGATTQAGAWVRAKVSGSSARLAVADNVGLTGPTWLGPVSPDAQGMVSWEVTGLDPDSRYWWAVEVDSVVDTDWSGQLRTHPVLGDPASFTFAASSCAGYVGSTPGAGYITDQVSDHPVFDTIRASDPLWFSHLGDLHYRDINSSDPADYRTAYDDVLTFNGSLGAASRQGQLYRAVPLQYVWDDHCYGPGDSDGTYSGKAAAAQVYRERVPHYALPGEGVHQSWQVGRVLFIAADSRYYRSPKTDADGPAKTMLGSEQLAWMESTLASSDAAALVWIHPVEWLGDPQSGGDNWRGYSYERDQVTAMLQDLGWADRMIMLVGDRHSMGMSTGGDNNPWGGWPVYMYSSMDSSYGTLTAAPYYDLGLSPGRNQWGQLVVVDDGSQISITNRGMIGSSPWRIHTHTIGASAPPPAPPPTRTQAVPRDRVTWLGCDLVSGRIIAELPEITGRISRVLGAYTSTELTLPIPLGGPGAVPIGVVEEATVPAQTMMVAVVNDVPTWAGIVIARQGGTDATLRLGCVSLEGYLDRRYVGDHAWTGQDQASVIAAGLIADAQVEGIGLDVDAPASGVLRDRTYADQDDATVYSRLRELAAVQGGPEWTVDLDWASPTRQAVAKVVRVRSRIGEAAATPHAVFASVGSSDATYTYTEDYSDGRGANHVVATSSGEGESRPQSTPAADVPAGRARWERRWSPGSSITDQAVLDAHAVAELALRRDGATTIQITARWDQTPRLNVDWQLGDDVGWDLQGHRHPGGLVGTGRVIGWELDIQAGLIRPILWQPGGTL